MRYFLLTIKINGKKGYRCNQIRKKNFEIFEIENFEHFCKSVPGTAWEWKSPHKQFGIIFILGLNFPSNER